MLTITNLVESVDSTEELDEEPKFKILIWEQPTTGVVEDINNPHQWCQHEFRSNGLIELISRSRTDVKAKKAA